MLSALLGQEHGTAAEPEGAADFQSDPEEPVVSPRSSRKRAKPAPKSARASTRIRARTQVCCRHCLGASCTAVHCSCVTETMLLSCVTTQATAEAAGEQLEKAQDKAAAAAGQTRSAAARVLHSLQRTPQTLYSYATRTGDSVRESVSQLHLGDRFHQAWDSITPQQVQQQARSGNV